MMWGGFLSLFLIGGSCSIKMIKVLQDKCDNCLLGFVQTPFFRPQADSMCDFQ